MVKNQHYVPQFYMKYWGSGKDNKHLYQYLKSNNKITPCSTDDKGCCNSPFLYEIDHAEGDIVISPLGDANFVENEFMRREGIWSQALANIFATLDNDDSLLDCDRIFICEFVASLFVRNPDISADVINKNVQIAMETIRMDELGSAMLAVSARHIPDFETRILPNYLSKAFLLPYSDMHMQHASPIAGYMHGSFFNELYHNRRLFVLRSINSSFIFANRPTILEKASDFEYVFCPLSPKYACLFVKKKYVNLWVRFSGIVSNRVSNVSDLLAAALLYPYFYAPRYTRLFGSSELQLKHMKEIVDHRRAFWSTPYDIKTM